MPDTPDGQRRRMWWIVALIVFMLALAAVYIAMMGHRPAAPNGVVTVNTVDRTP